MPDIVDAPTRSRMMAGIRGRDTKIELAVRKALHRRGLRYRLKALGVPGRPDIIFKSRRAAVFVHGCFWHGHDCHLFRSPRSNRDFWGPKIDRNRARDAEVRRLLAEAGWRQLVVWECSMRNRGPGALDDVADEAEAWVRRGSGFHEIRGP